MATKLNVVARAQAQQVVRVSVVEVPLLRLRPVPLQLVFKDGPVEVFGKEIDYVFVVYVGPADA